MLHQSSTTPGSKATGAAGAERNAVALICGKITEVYIFGSDCNILEVSLKQCGVAAAVRAHKSETRMLGFIFLEVDVISVEVVPSPRGPRTEASSRRC